MRMHILSQQRKRNIFLFPAHLETVKYLVSIGADIHAYNDFAVKYAYLNNHLKTIKYLISIGADIHAENYYAI